MKGRRPQGSPRLGTRGAAAGFAATGYQGSE